MILRVLASAAVIALLIAGWLALSSEQDGPTVAPPSVRAAGNPGYTASNADLVETGPDGRPMYTLHAAEIRQPPAAQFAVLDDVTMQFRDQTGQLWNGRANRGLVWNGASQIDLSGAVRLWGSLASTQQSVQISSERLAVDTRTEIVNTNDPVVLEWGRQRLQARGLVAHLREQHVKLESDVHGTYQP